MSRHRNRKRSTPAAAISAVFVKSEEAQGIAPEVIPALGIVPEAQPFIEAVQQVTEPVQPVRAPTPRGRPMLTDWKPMDMAPRQGEPIWVAGNGMVREAKWIAATGADDGFWSDLLLTAGAPVPRRLMFEPVAWASEEA